MNFPRNEPAKLRLLVLFVVCLSMTIASHAQVEWRPVSPAELAMTEPKVEKDADAEAIFWETRMDDRKLSKLTISHYVRVKIFNERGRERFSKLDIPFMKGKKIEDVAARVIKADGSIVELQPSDIFEREIAKQGKARVLAKSFAVPGIEPGAIVEYQYVETIKDDSVGGERLYFQRDIPMQQVTYYIRPFGKQSLRFNWYNLPETRFRDDPRQKGYQVSTMYDVPAYKEEPYMPPDDEVRKWAYVSYNTLGGLLVWNNLSIGYDAVMKRMAKPNKDIKQLATELTSGVASEDEKLRRIYEFTQRQIRNISYDRSLTEEQREKIKIKDADDVLRQKAGSTMFIDLLFASIAKAAGFEVTIALTSDRSENFFNPDKYPFRNFIEPSGIAVKVDREWKFFSPGVPFLPYAQTLWFRENANSMLVGDGGYLWTRPRMLDHTESPAKRTGRFTLSDDGTLEGTVKIEYDGHQAISRRRDEYRDSDSKREENLRDEIKARISTAEVTAISIQNFDDNSKPLVYQYKIKVPNYAQKAGRRLLFQPGFFESGSSPVFSTDTRTYDVYIPYPWSEKDDIRIELPKGFELDAGERPSDLADPKRIGALDIVIKHDKSANAILYERNFHFGGGSNVFFPVAAYPALKNLFDAFHKSDTHSLMIKPSAN